MMQAIPYIWVILLFPTIFLCAALFAWAMQASILRKISHKQFSQAQTLFFKDRWIRFELLLIFIYAFAVYGMCFFSCDRFISVIVWGGGACVTFEIVRRMFKRMQAYTSSSFLLKMAEKVFTHELKKGRESKALEWIDTYIETMLKAGEKGEFSVVQCALDTTQNTLSTYMQVVSLTEVFSSEKNSAASVFDRFSYLCMYVCKRLEWVFQKMIEKRMEPIAEEIVAAFGKLGLFCLKQHQSLGRIPFSSLLQCVQVAQQQGFSEVVTRAIVTVSETAKRCIAASVEQQGSYKDTIISLILDLEVLVKAEYKKNKEMNPALLMQPFAEIAQFLGESSYQSAFGREDILKELRRLLTEFQALELVLQNTLSSS